MCAVCCTTSLTTISRRDLKGLMNALKTEETSHLVLTARSSYPARSSLVLLSSPFVYTRSRRGCRCSQIKTVLTAEQPHQNILPHCLVATEGFLESNSQTCQRRWLCQKRYLGLKSIILQPVQLEPAGHSFSVFRRQKYTYDIRPTRGQILSCFYEFKVLTFAVSVVGSKNLKIKIVSNSWFSSKPKSFHAK